MDTGHVNFVFWAMLIIKLKVKPLKMCIKEVMMKEILLFKVVIIKNYKYKHFETHFFSLIHLYVYKLQQYLHNVTILIIYRTYMEYSLDRFSRWSLCSYIRILIHFLFVDTMRSYPVCLIHLHLFSVHFWSEQKLIRRNYSKISIAS